MSDNGDVLRGRRPASNAVSHADFERRRGSAGDWSEASRPTNVTAVDSASATGGIAGGFSGVDRLGAADNSRQNMNEWAQAKSSFASLQDEADAVARMFDQEKKHILGMAQSLGQIQDSFERLHSRFSDIDARVESFENISGRLTYRLESTFDALQDSKNNEAELEKNYRELRTALENQERKWTQQADDIRALAEDIRTLVGENRALAEENHTLHHAVGAAQRDTKLIVAEIANLHSKIALLEEQLDMESLFVRPEPGLSRPAPAPFERAIAVPHDPQRVLQETDVSPPASDDQIDQQLSELDESIEFHKHELGRMQVQAETLIARYAAESAVQRPVAAPSEPARPADKAGVAATAPSRPASERKLSDLQELSSSYQTLVQELEASRAALAHRAAAEPPEEREPPEAPPPDDTPEPLRTRRAQSAAAGGEYSKMNSMRSQFEKRTEDLKAELTQERRERKFAECALRVARAERLHLQHELAKVRAMGWRKVSSEAPAEPAPAREPEAVKRRFTAA